jgi:hypothetical protein
MTVGLRGESRRGEPRLNPVSLLRRRPDPMPSNSRTESSRDRCVRLARADDAREQRLHGYYSETGASVGTPLPRQVP